MYGKHIPWIFLLLLLLFSTKQGINTHISQKY